MTAQETLNKILNAKGNHVSIRYRTFPVPAKPKGENAGISLEKETRGAFCAGKNYANLTEVREAIEAGERGPVQAPNGRTWLEHPFILESTKTGEHLIRLYPATGNNQRPTSVYRVNGNEVSKEDFIKYLPASRINREAPKCFDVRITGILDLEEIAD